MRRVGPGRPPLKPRVVKAYPFPKATWPMLSCCTPADARNVDGNVSSAPRAAPERKQRKTQDKTDSDMSWSGVLGKSVRQKRNFDAANFEPMWLET